MIKSLSPYYVTTSFVSPLTAETCSEYTLQLYVWSGLKASVPASATYEVTIFNTEVSTGTSAVNISKLINDFVDFGVNSDTTTAIIDGDNQMWVQHDVIYTTTDANDDDVQQTITTALMISGYSYGNEGANESTPANKVLLSGTEFNINRAGYFSVPILIDEDTAGQEVIVTSYPNTDISLTLALPNTNNSTELVKYVWIDGAEMPTDTYVEVVYNGVTVTLYLTDECRYTPLDIVFQNKEGAMEMMTFFKAKKESLSVKSESYESDRGQPSDNFHQFITYNVNAKSNITVNSGFVDEDVNENFKQLFLSERIWSYDGTTFTPLTINSKSLEYKTRVNDRLINYEVKFDFAYNEINNI